jgi:hypothetical protein
MRASSSWRKLKTKEKKKMVRKKNLRVLRGALALAAVFMMTGNALAKKPASTGNAGAAVDLSADRKTVTVNVTPQCHTPTVPGGTLSAEYSIYIFQSVGRLINIGIGNGDVSCTALTPTGIEVDAIEGLTFQPGPATMIVKFTTFQTTTVPVIDPITNLPTGATTIVETAISTSESGARVNLH